MQSRNKFKRIVCIALAVIMTLSLVSTALILMVNAASSKEIEKELVDLRAQQAELKKQSDALKAEINQNEAETQTLIEKKADIDKQMDMSRQTIENLNAQIQQYSLLIADKQSELEDSLAEEAALTAQALGNRVTRLYDVGVAGLHRTLAHLDEIQSASVLIAVAGMEGALASVLGGLADCPVIAVPTSVGYGASFGGVAALLAMLNSCASGVSVVNIDNGFGAGFLASRINHMHANREETR